MLWFPTSPLCFQGRKEGRKVAREGRRAEGDSECQNYPLRDWKPHIQLAGRLLGHNSSAPWPLLWKGTMEPWLPGGVGSCRDLQPKGKSEAATVGGNVPVLSQLKHGARPGPRSPEASASALMTEGPPPHQQTRGGKPEGPETGSHRRAPVEAQQVAGGQPQAAHGRVRLWFYLTDRYIKQKHLVWGSEGVAPIEGMSYQWQGSGF